MGPRRPPRWPRRGPLRSTPTPGELVRLQNASGRGGRAACRHSRLEATLSADQVDAAGRRSPHSPRPRRPPKPAPRTSGPSPRRGAGGASPETRAALPWLDYSTACATVSAALGPPARRPTSSLRQDWDELADWAGTTNVERRRRASSAGLTLKETSAACTPSSSSSPSCASRRGEPPGDLLDIVVRAPPAGAGRSTGRPRGRPRPPTASSCRPGRGRERRPTCADQQVASKLARELLKAPASSGGCWRRRCADLVAGATGVLHSLSNGTYSLALEPRDLQLLSQRPRQRRRGPLGPDAVGRGDVPGVAVARAGPGRRA